ncbi:MAG: hypothetical protein ACR652_05840 [Methylocystis sp.]|uniref:hypothetical protein n=1 Tax=Methylocystis sp. TaxID=1911079 RepID=UPI003DA25EEA
MWRLWVAAGALALMALWFFLPWGGEETAVRIARRAGLDLVEACNKAAEAAGAPERFSAADVLPARLAEGQGGVVAMVSALEARRDGLTCRWDGVEPAALARRR